MLMIAHGSLEDLDKCRLVCRTWYEVIMNKIWENPTKKWGTIIQRRIKKSWGNQDYYPSDEKISRAKLFGKSRVTKILILIKSIILETRGILDTEVIENLVERVKEALHYYTSSLPLITCAASLAHHRLLGSVWFMDLRDADLTSVPAEHLASLASSVTGIVVKDLTLSLSWPVSRLEC